MPKTVGIGIQDFRKVVERDCFYIDKTLFIKEWWESQDDVTLITRPRRFGKTLTLSMTEQFFSVKYRDSGWMFEPFAIWKEEKYQRLQGTYPVVNLSFSRVKGSNFQLVREKICQILAEVYQRHTFLLEGDLLSDSEKEFFHQVTDKMDDAVAGVACNRISEYLVRYYGKKVILLLDEYDTPMQEAYIYGYWKEMSDFIRSMFAAALKDNPYLERALLTGITRVSKESVFSDLNHLKVVTTTSRKYQSAFGFTEQEVFSALEEYGLADRKQEVKLWYDGFQFGNCGNLYNPWSIINYLDEREFDDYWVNTSSNKLVEQLIGKGSANVKRIVEELLKGRDFRTKMDENIVYHDLHTDEGAIWSLLLASGYLKVKNCVKNSSGEKEYVLALTNREVVCMFRRMVRNWFSVCSSNYNDFIKAMLVGDLEAMNAYMNRVALATFSMFDAGIKPSQGSEPERFYHGFFLGLSVELSDRYTVTSNRESGFGRYDVMFEPTDSFGNGMIIEFKVHAPSKEKSLEDTVSAALSQIIEKKYSVKLESKGIPEGRIRIYGFAFRGKEVLIGGGWLADFYGK
ncbi:MAG: ATP-binding protein [Eubacterium sp.]|nr:ATP-binding protein [Eubacterium sp.]